MKYKCPWCPKELQSPNDIHRHCWKYHGVHVTADAKTGKVTEASKKG